MGADIEGLVHCILDGADELDDKEVLRHLKSVAKVHNGSTLMSIYNSLLGIQSTTSARVARMLCMNFSNQLSTVAVSHAPATGTKKSTKERRKDKSFISTYNGRLKDPLYREFIKCLFKNSVYNPHSKNLEGNIGDIMTWANCQQVLRDSGVDPEVEDHSNRLARYIRNLTRRLSPSGIKRSGDTTTPATTFYHEYRLVFEPHDPFNLKTVTDMAHREMSSAPSDTAENPECDEHIPLNKSVLMVDARIASSEEGRDIRVYKLGQARSACTGGVSCTCKECVHILVKEVYESPYTTDNLIVDTDLHDRLESGLAPISPPEYFQKDSYVQWPRQLLLETAPSIQDIREEERAAICEKLKAIDHAVIERKRYSESERLEQLSKWVQEKKTAANWTSRDEAFVCPRPRNKQTGDMESHLGNWLNYKSHEARDQRKREDQRLKAINLLNGPVAEMLGYGENWFCGPPGRRRNTKHALFDVTNTNNRRMRKRSTTEMPDSEEQSEHMGPGVRSKRARQVKPNRNPLYAY